MRHLTIAAVAVVVTTVIPSAASAQAPEPDAATTFADLALRLPAQSSVTITNHQGRRTRGELTGIAGETLSIKTGDHALTFTESDVRHVQRCIPDTVLNGAFIGMASGTACPLIVCTIVSDRSERVSCAVGAFVMGGLPGFAIGTLIDRLRSDKVTLFRSSDSNRRAVTISPVVARRGIGIQMSMRVGS